MARTRAERFVERILAAIPVIPFDLDIARVHARIDAELSAAGTRIGDGDLMIGATAVWLDYRMATRDLRSFPKITGLPFVRWWPRIERPATRPFTFRFHPGVRAGLDTARSSLEQVEAGRPEQAEASLS